MEMKQLDFIMEYFEDIGATPTVYSNLAAAWTDGDYDYFLIDGVEGFRLEKLNCMHEHEVQWMIPVPDNKKDFRFLMKIIND